MANKSISESNNAIPRVTHYGALTIEKATLEAVVLEDGTRGYVQRQLAQAVGFLEKRPTRRRFALFLAEISPKALIRFHNTSQEVRMTIANSSVSYADFQARCRAAFPHSRQIRLVYPLEVVRVETCTA